MSGRYKAYPEYKESGLLWMSKVPTHWTEMRFKHVLADKKKTLRPDLPAGSISFGRVVYKDAEILSNETKASYQEVLSGEFLVNPLNLNYDLMSLRTALSSIDVVVSTGYIVLQSSGRLHPNYTRWLLQQFDVAHMKTLGAGVRQTINFADIGNSFFFEPSLPEQIQIAAFLDHETAKIDRLIEKQQALISLLKEKRQAVISHAVTKGLPAEASAKAGLNPHLSSEASAKEGAPLKDSGIEWLGQVPAHWTVRCIKHVFKNLDCRRIPLSSEERGRRSGDFDYYGASGVIDKIDDYIFDEPTILVGEDGANLVNRATPLAYSAKGKYWVNNHAHILSAEDGLVDYWAEAIEHIDVNPIVSGSAQPKLTAEALGNLKICFPPTIKERLEISGFIEAQKQRFDALIERAAAQVTLLQERRTALISAAVTGKIDVRHWQPSSEQSN